MNPKTIYVIYAIDENNHRENKYVSKKFQKAFSHFEEFVLSDSELMFELVRKIENDDDSEEILFSTA